MSKNTDVLLIRRAKLIGRPFYVAHNHNNSSLIAAVMQKIRIANAH